MKLGDFVQIVSNGDCCQGKRGRIVGSSKSKWLVQTDKHICSRPEAELATVPANILAQEYFEIEGWDVFTTYKELLACGTLKLDEIESAAQGGNPDCRHFLALYEPQAA